MSPVGQMSFTLITIICLLTPGCFSDSGDSSFYCQDDSYIDYDSHYACKIDLDVKQDIEISWNISIPEQENWNGVDVYVMDKKNYDDYISDEYLFGSCEEFVYVEEVSLEYVGNYELNHTTINLDLGEWFFVVDNKGCSGTSPVDDLRVDSYVEIIL
jgi:hypothetical protein